MIKYLLDFILKKNIFLKKIHKVFKKKSLYNIKMERIQKMTLDEKRTLTAEQKAVRKKLLRNQYYRDYYSKNKDTYKINQDKYKETSDYKNKQNERLKNKYSNDLEFRCGKKLEYYKRNYNVNEDIQNIINNKELNNSSKLKEIKLFFINSN